jgi:hypothetical protein
MLGRIAHTGVKQHLQAVCLRSFALARGAHRSEITLDRPIFIVGCGRSGTTIFGRCLGQHEDVGYLNEPRLLWKVAFPRSDISSRFAPRVGGSLVLGENDWNPAGARLLRFLFASELRRRRRTRLCEKTPGNEFRLGLISRVFPDAKYLWIVRDRRRVAQSIQKLADRALHDFGWYGFRDYKWHQLEKLVRELTPPSEMPRHSRSNLERGLIEWRMSIRYAEDFFRCHPQLPMLQIRYEHLTADPAGTMCTVSEFAELPHSPQLLRWAARHVNRGDTPPPSNPSESARPRGLDCLSLGRA